MTSSLQNDSRGNPFGQTRRSGRNLPEPYGRGTIASVGRVPLANFPSVLSIISGGSGRTGYLSPQMFAQSHVRGSHLPARGDALTRGRTFVSNGAVSSPSVDRFGPRESPVVFGQPLFPGVVIDAAIKNFEWARSNIMRRFGL